MFTGIIQSLATVENINKDKNIYSIKTNLNLKDSKVGSSICCDGVCLTATKIYNLNSYFVFEVNIGEETLKRSNIINWKIGTKINVEKSLRVGDEISGHFVYGHVDATIYVEKINKLTKSWKFKFSFSKINNSLKFKNFIVEKGSIAINGISLTIANVYDDNFDISIIPHTYKNTNLSFLKENDNVNIEFDPLARYIKRKNEY